MSEVRVLIYQLRSELIKCEVLPVVLRRGREEHGHKDDDGDEEAEIERVTADLSPATPPCGLLYHHTVTVFQSEAEVLGVVLDGFITGDVAANKLEVFVRLVTREGGAGGLPVLLHGPGEGGRQPGGRPGVGLQPLGGHTASPHRDLSRGYRTSEPLLSLVTPGEAGVVLPPAAVRALALHHLLQRPPVVPPPGVHAAAAGRDRLHLSLEARGH